MSFNNDLSNPDLLENFDFEQFLENTDDGFNCEISVLGNEGSPEVPSVEALPLPQPKPLGHQEKERELDAINVVDQSNEEMEKLIAGEDQDTRTGPLDGHVIMPRQQHESLEGSQQRLNPGQKFQHLHSVPMRHQQGQTHLKKATTNATATAGSKLPAHQGPNDSSPASAHYLNQYGDSNNVMPRHSAAQSMSSLAQQPVQGNSGYSTCLPSLKSGASQQKAISNTQQQQAQQHHAAQQYIAAQRQQLQRPQQDQQARLPQQHANVSGFYQMYQAQGNGQAQQSLSQAQSIQGDPPPFWSPYQSAAPLPPQIVEPPQMKRGRPSKDEDEHRVRKVLVPVSPRQLSRTSRSHSQVRPTPGRLPGSAHGSDYSIGSKVQSEEQGMSSTYDDLMQEVEAAVMGSPPSVDLIISPRVLPTHESDIAGQTVPSPPINESYVVSHHRRTSEPGVKNATLINEHGKEDKRSTDERAKFAMDDMSVDLDLDLDPVTAVVPGALPNTESANQDLVETRSRNDKSARAGTSKRPERKSKTKSKSGCLTCRKRHVRCGEERPSCQICVKTGRGCELYAPAIVHKSPLGSIRYSDQTQQRHGRDFDSRNDPERYTRKVEYNPRQEPTPLFIISPKSQQIISQEVPRVPTVARNRRERRLESDRKDQNLGKRR